MDRANRKRSSRVVNLEEISRLAPIFQTGLAFATRSNAYYGIKKMGFRSGTRMTTVVHSALANALPPNAAVSEDDYKATFPSQALYRLLHSMRLDPPKKAL